MIYECSRCDYETSQITNLRKHLSRKIICEDLKNCGLSADCLLQELDKDKSDYQHKCSYCDEKYQSISGKNKHEAKCKLIKEIIRLKDENEKFKIKYKEQEIEIKLLKNMLQNQEQIIPPTPIVQNKINYDDLIINCCGKENMSYISDEFIIQCILNGINGVCELINEIHFNKDHPENHNIRNIDDKHYQIIIEKNMVSTPNYIRKYFKLNFKYEDKYVYTITKKIALHMHILKVSETVFKNFINTCSMEMIGQENIIKFIKNVVFQLGWSMDLIQENKLECNIDEDTIHDIFIQIINSIDKNCITESIKKQKK